MKFKDIKHNLKKDPAGSVWIELYRKVGLFFTWIIVNLFPKIKANHVTGFILFLNLISVGFIYFGIVNTNYILIAVSFFINFIASALDCTDGNIARLKKETSYKGIFIDRLTHNIHHPSFFIVIGFAVFQITNNQLYLALFIISGILSKFSPFEVAVKDVKNSFINQLINKKSLNFDLSSHINVDEKTKTEDLSSQKTNYSNKNKLMKTLRYIFTFLLSFEIVYLVLVLDLIFKLNFILLIIFVLVYIFVFFTKDILKNDLKSFMINLKKLEEGLDD